jgi:hypothetical protein
MFKTRNSFNTPMVVKFHSCVSDKILFPSTVILFLSSLILAVVYESPLLASFVAAFSFYVVLSFTILVMLSEESQHDVLLLGVFYIIRLPIVIFEMVVMRFRYV